MRWVPRADQERVLEFLWTRERAAVWGGVGVGKTAIAATWAQDAMYDRFTVPRLLIVAPKMVARDNWPHQLRQWDHLSVIASDFRVLTFDDLDLTPSLLPGGRRGALTFRDRPATKKHLLQMRERVHIASWDAWPHLVKAYGANWPYQGVIFDESSFLRDWSSDRTRAARHVVRNLNGAPWMLQLTASPNSNKSDAAFPQIDLLAPGLLGRTLTEFRERWCLPDARDWRSGQVYSYKLHPGLSQQMEALIADIAVSVPGNLATPLLEVEQGVDLPEATRRAYEALERDWVWDGVVAGSEAVLHGKLRELAQGFVYDGNGEARQLCQTKMERLAELVESIDAPVLIAFEFKEELRRLKALFKNNIQDIREPGAKDAFLKRKLKLLAVHPASAGHGVDGLQTVCNNVIWTSVPQDREFFDQLNGRIHRTGTQADTVFCHLLVARGTREERIFREVLPGKLTLAEAFMSGVRLPPREKENQ